LREEVQELRKTVGEKEAAAAKASANYARVKQDREKIKVKVKSFQESVRVRIAELRKDEGSLILAVKSVLATMEQASPLALSEAIKRAAYDTEKTQALVQRFNGKVNELSKQIPDLLKKSTSSYKDTKSKSRIYVNPYVRDLFVTVLEKVCLLTTRSNTTSAAQKTNSDTEDLRYKIETLQTEVQGLQQVKGLLNNKVSSLINANRKLKKNRL